MTDLEGQLTKALEQWIKHYGNTVAKMPLQERSEDLILFDSRLVGRVPRAEKDHAASCSRWA